jgi:hypothetical protein
MADAKYEAQLERTAKRCENIMIGGFVFFAIVVLVGILRCGGLVLIGGIGCGMVVAIWAITPNAVRTRDIYRISKAERQLRGKLGYYPCGICRQKSDMQWNCGHYFCRDCRDVMKPDNKCPLDSTIR